MDRNAEIERIEDELERLRARYALYERWGGILRIFFTICVPLVVAALVIKLFIADALMGVFVGIVALSIALICWLMRNPAPHRLFWTDLASLPARKFGPSPIKPEARMVEEEITARERRLAELKAAS
jgi:hypothetical protein